ncbi:biopolymer transporter ExbD [Thiomonas sp. FB-Cd]|uniref:ExbD/TolR family protein n=1 Tax=Thiomonas sp. FB-Cd TaxID=1158292 RepID=UPI0004DF4FBB|nr:biopolymer transporter ExbD [Thiomonas sp. FB-Cd]
MSFGRFDRGADDTPMSDINMTPLIDVMLVLLVIFIITAPLLSGRIAVDLPKIDTAPAHQTPKSLSVSIQKDQKIFLGAQSVTLAQLTARFMEAAKASSDTELQIRADTAVPYGRVAHVMAAAQKAGLSRIGLMTHPANAASGATP